MAFCVCVCVRARVHCSRPAHDRFRYAIPLCFWRQKFIVNAQLRSLSRIILHSMFHAWRSFLMQLEQRARLSNKVRIIQCG